MNRDEFLEVRRYAIASFLAIRKFVSERTVLFFEGMIERFIQRFFDQG